MKKSKPVKKLKDFKKLPTAPGSVNETALIETGEKVYYSNWEVHPAGNANEIYSPTGYSKHAARLIAFQEGKIKHPAKIYGLPQALDHIEELRLSITDGKKILENQKFEVVEVTIIKTIYKTQKL